MDLELPEECDRLLTIESLIAALLQGGVVSAFILWAPTIPGEQVAFVREAIRESGRPCIEVRPEAWDGQTPSPLSAACRGVISGFGAHGILAAVEFLRSEVPPTPLA